MQIAVITTTTTRNPFPRKAGEKRGLKRGHDWTISFVECVRSFGSRTNNGLRFEKAALLVQEAGWHIPGWTEPAHLDPFPINFASRTLSLPVCYGRRQPFVEWPEKALYKKVCKTYVKAVHQEPECFRKTMATQHSDGGPTTITFITTKNKMKRCQSDTPNTLHHGLTNVTLRGASSFLIYLVFACQADVAVKEFRGGRWAGGGGSGGCHHLVNPGNLDRSKTNVGQTKHCWKPTATLIALQQVIPNWHVTPPIRCIPTTIKIVLKRQWRNKRYTKETFSEWEPKTTTPKTEV